MVDAVLADRRLEPVAALRHPHLLDTAEPRLAVLEEAATGAAGPHPPGALTVAPQLAAGERARWCQSLI